MALGQRGASRPVRSPRAAVYTRISNDLEGLEKGVERQRQDCEALAARLRFDIVAMFVENDVSASTRSRKPRPKYDDMLARARLGEFEVILAYSSSRLTRRPLEVEDLIRLREQHGVRIHTVVSGDDDLNTADGRLVARIKGSVDAAESERISERGRRAKAQAFSDGKFRGGPRPYGFHPDGVTILKSEADVIRYATNAVLAGQTVSKVARTLNGRGHRTSKGAQWVSSSLRTMLLRSRNAGLVSTGIPGQEGFTLGGRAQWSAVVPPRKWHALLDLLTGPTRGSEFGTHAPMWIGAGIYRCARPTGGIDDSGRAVTCGAPLWAIVWRRARSPMEHEPRRCYRCENLHLSVAQRPIDDLVREFVAEKLSDPNTVASILPTTVAAAAALERRELLTTRLRAFENDYVSGLIPGDLFARALQTTSAEIAGVDATLARNETSSAAPILTAPAPAEAFQSASVEAQRAVIASMVRVEVLPGKHPGRWSPSRVRFTMLT